MGKIMNATDPGAYKPKRSTARSISLTIRCSACDMEHHKAHFEPRIPNPDNKTKAKAAPHGTMRRSKITKCLCCRLRSTTGGRITTQSHTIKRELSAAEIKDMLTKVGTELEREAASLRVKHDDEGAFTQATVENSMYTFLPP